MTLRQTLFGLIGLFGLALFGVAGGGLLSAYLDSQALAGRARLAADREAVYSLVHAIKAEELVTLERLAGQRPSHAGGGTARPAAAVTDAALSRALALARARPADQDADLLRLLLDLRTALCDRRAGRPAQAVAQTAATAPDAATLDAFHRSLFTQTRLIDQLATELEDTRDLSDPEAQDAALHALYTLRGLGLRAFGDVLDNRIRIETLLATPRTAPIAASESQMLRATTAAMIGAASLSRDHARSAPGPDTDPAVQALDLLAEIYSPAEGRILDALDAPATLTDPANTIAAWRAASRGTLHQFVHAEAELSAVTRTRLAEAARILRARLIANGLFALGVAAALVLALRHADRRILSPLASLRSRIAPQGGQAHPVPKGDLLPEFAALSAALDARDAKARTRGSVQAELARLGDRAVTENREMLADLEAAARVQRAQLPASPRAIPGATFHALYRPSRVIAGDTYDCITRADGRTTLFQIDVAGHGAPAAIVSVASHVAMKQALLSAPPGESLGATIARVNRDWGGDLPYFTLVAVEVDPVTASAEVVQCGHPPLLRLPAGGGIEVVGKGGLPIGVLPDAGFKTLACPFLPGDRLVLATDGVTEASDPQRRMFGDDRFHDLLLSPANSGIPAIFSRIEQALWDWRGSEMPDDDVTILILEAR